MNLRQFLAAARQQLVVVVFALVGVALLAGAGLAYYVTITRPLAWPRASARIVASRVVNPVNPTQYQPEFVFELADRRGPRQVAVGAAWNSGSYDFVRAFVDRYPVGTTLDVAVNPDDADDLRYELGPTRANLILPGSLGVMGAIFVLCAVGTLMWRGPSVSDAAASGFEVSALRERAIAGGLLGMGAVFTLLGGLLRRLLRRR